MIQVQAYKSSDGRLFDTQEQALEWEHSLLWQDKIANFSMHSTCPYPSGAQQGMMRKIIIAWELFKTQEKA